MHTYYFTFGFNHEDRNGDSLGNAFVPIQAEDEESARDRMVRLRGDKWAFLYTDKKATGVSRFNLREVTEFQIDIRERRKEAEIEKIISPRRAELERQIALLEKMKEVMRKLPEGLISKCHQYAEQVDIDQLTRAETIEVLSLLKAGKWTKTINTQHDGTLDYTGEVDGVKVRLWAAGAPETCRMVEVEEVIPEQRIIRRKLICSHHQKINHEHDQTDPL